MLTSPVKLTIKVNINTQIIVKFQGSSRLTKIYQYLHWLYNFT